MQIKGILLKFSKSQVKLGEYKNIQNFMWVLQDSIIFKYKFTENKMMTIKYILELDHKQTMNKLIRSIKYQCKHKI